MQAMQRLLSNPPQFLLALAGLATGVFIAFFCWAMLVPLGDTPPLFPFEDKVKHFVAFGLMAGPAALMFSRHQLIFVFTTMATLAAGIEIAQGASGLGREPSFWDFIAGAAGAACACYIGDRVRKLFSASV